MTRIDELRQIMKIESAEERQAVALAWWEELNETEQEQLRQQIKEAIATVLPVWESFMGYLGEMGRQLAENWSRLVSESPEMRAYIAKLSEIDT